MLEWLKNILGDGYTEEIDKQVGDEIGKAYAPRADLDSANEARAAAEAQLADANKTIAGYKDMDIDAIRQSAADWQAKAEQAQKDADARVAAVGCCDNGVPVKGVHCINKILCSIVGWLLTCFYFHCENRQNQCKQKEQYRKNTYSLFHRSRHISSYFLCLLTIFRFIFGAFTAFVTGLVLADVLFNGFA